MENIKTLFENTTNFQVIKQKCKNDSRYIKFYVKNNEILYIEYDCELYYYQPNEYEFGIELNHGDLKLEYYNFNQTKKLEVESTKDINCFYITEYSNFDDNLILTLEL